MERERRVVEWVLQEKDRYRRVGVADWRHVDGWDLQKAEGARGGLVAGERPSVRPLCTGGGYFWSGGGVLFWRSSILVFLWYSKI
jgi:hypothetical protein